MLADHPKCGQIKMQAGHRIHYSLINDLVKYSLADKQVLICRNNWVRDRLADRLKGAVQWNIQQLRVTTNSEPGIIRDIMHIGFTQLTLIDISTNHIETLENFNRVNFPVLQTLICMNNHISTINTLRKINCPALKHLDLDGNELRVYSQLWQCNLPNLIELDFSMYSHHISIGAMRKQYEKAHFNFVWMAKLNSRVHQLLTVIKPLYPKGFIKSLERKWNSMLDIQVGKRIG